MSTLGQILGVGVILLVIGKYHAAVVASPPYDFSNSFRFWWTAFYGAAVVFTAYAFGLPEVGRTPKHALLAAVGATSVAAIAVSAVQLLLGVAVLPRFVVFGGAGLLVPWFVGMAALGRDARSWSASRDRVVVVADWMDASDLELELSTSSELPATISANLSPRKRWQQQRERGRSVTGPSNSTPRWLSWIEPRSWNRRLSSKRQRYTRRACAYEPFQSLARSGWVRFHCQSLNEFR